MKLIYKIGVFVGFALLFIFQSTAQELNAEVVVNSQKIQSNNRQIYTTLTNSIKEFLNQTRWTNKTYQSYERIKCAFNIVLESQEGNKFKASIQVQSSRPVYNSTYLSPLLNINDTKFEFKYNEFDPLYFNERAFESSLVSTLSYYVYLVLGFDADTFEIRGGEKYFLKAKNIADIAQQKGLIGWENEVGTRTRFTIVDNLLLKKLNIFHHVYYNYHRKGLDIFADNPKLAKQTLEQTLFKLDKLYSKVIGNHLFRLFIDAKSEEIVHIFSGGEKSGNEQKLQELLTKLAPYQKSLWEKISF